jgi:hypothetical protein
MSAIRSLTGVNRRSCGQQPNSVANDQERSSRCHGSGAEFKTAATAISGRKSGSFERRRKVVPSVGNRTNDPRRVSSDKSIGGNVPGDYGTRRNNGILAHRHSADDRCAGCDPYVSFNHDGPCDCEGAPPRRFDRMARRDDAHVRPDHHIVGNVEPAKIIKKCSSDLRKHCARY